MRWRYLWRAPRIGLALSGGGARGFAHVGVLEVLSSLGIRPFAISGTSIGSLVGAMAAAQLPITRMRSTATSIQWTKLVRPVLPGSSGLLSLAPLENLLEDLLGGITRFEELPIPFVCMATDVERDRPVVLKSGKLAPAVRASCTVPGIFTPVELGGCLLVDGGVSNNLPVRVLHEMGADYVIAVDLMPERTKAERPRSMIEVMVVTFYNMVRATSREGALADLLLTPEIRDFGFAELGGREVLMARGREAATKVAARLTGDLRLGRIPLSQRFYSLMHAWLRTRRFIESAILRREVIAAIPAEVSRKKPGE